MIDFWTRLLWHPKPSRYMSNIKEYVTTWKWFCEVCGEKKVCIMGRFEGGMNCVCTSCFTKEKAFAEVPDSVRNQLTGAERQEKIEALRRTPPILWCNEENVWPVCCDDFMTYQGNWFTMDSKHYHNTPENIAEYAEFLNSCETDTLDSAEKILQEMEGNRVDYIFVCPHCRKRKVIFQIDQEEE